MRKGWQYRKINENCLGIKFTRWYFIAPSGNKYFFFRGPYFSTIYVPITYKALSTDTNDNVEYKSFKTNTGKKTRQYKYTLFNGEVVEYTSIVDDRYEQALEYIYQIEEKGGFPEQNMMNKWLTKKNEMIIAFNQNKKSISYYSY